MLNFIELSKPSVIITLLISFAISISIVLLGFVIGNIYSYFVMIAAAIILAIFAVRYPLFFLISLTILVEKGFKTIDFGIPFWTYVDVALVVLAVGIAAQFFKNVFKSKKLLTEISHNIYFRYILFIILLTNIATFVGGSLIFEHPTVTLLFRTRAFFLYLIFLYLLMADFNSGQIRQFFTFGLISTLIISTLLIIDARLLGGGRIFYLAMSDGISGTRLGNIRISSNEFLTPWMYFYLLSIMKHKANDIKKIVCFLFIPVILYQVIYIGIGRQTIMSLFLATILFLYTFKANPKLIVICCSIFMCILMAIVFLGSADFLKNNFIYKLIDMTFYEAHKTHSGNIAIRINGIRYFLPYFAHSPWVGMGILSSTYKNSPVTLGLKMGYNFADFGLFSILFRFGIVSIFLLFFLLRRVFSDLKLCLSINNEHMKAIVDSILYLFISLIILIPSTTIFFREPDSLYYGMLLYFIYRIKKDTGSVSLK